jgi:hypothetical protein
MNALRKELVANVVTLVVATENPRKPENQERTAENLTADLVVNVIRFERF